METPLRRIAQYTIIRKKVSTKTCVKKSAETAGRTAAEPPAAPLIFRFSALYFRISVALDKIICYNHFCTFITF